MAKAATVDWKPIMDAAFAGDAAGVARQLARGVAVDVRSPNSHRHPAGSAVAHPDFSNDLNIPGAGTSAESSPHCPLAQDSQAPQFRSFSR